MEECQKCFRNLVNPKIFLLSQKNITAADRQSCNSRPRDNRRLLKCPKVPAALHVSPLKTTSHTASANLHVTLIFVRENGDATPAYVLHIAQSLAQLGFGNPLKRLGSFPFESHDGSVRVISPPVLKSWRI
jgi:hypothetical protein